MYDGSAYAFSWKFIKLNTAQEKAETKKKFYAKLYSVLNVMGQVRKAEEHQKPL